MKTPRYSENDVMAARPVNSPSSFRTAALSDLARELETIAGLVRELESLAAGAGPAARPPSSSFFAREPRIILDVRFD
jgi:hypothetical protein